MISIHWLIREKIILFGKSIRGGAVDAVFRKSDGKNKHGRGKSKQREGGGTCIRLNDG